jgi:subtilisin family serine protease
MKSRIFKIVAALMLVSMLFAPLGGMSSMANAATTPNQAVKHTLAASETGIYIVRLQDASLAAYKGGVAGFQATSPEATGERKLDPSTPNSQAYLDYLGGKQSELLGNMAKAFGHPVEAVYQYKNVLNAVAVRIDHAEALQAFDLPGVMTVYPDLIRQLETDVGPILIGAPSIWDGDTLGGMSSKGEGIIIGVIDTGINHAHPSFADPAAKDGYDHTNPYGAGNYVGVCATDPLYADFCNDKLIGAYDFTDTGGPEDVNGHGSHTASTAGGNFVDVEFDDGVGGTFTVEIRGVAPHANLIAYQVCDIDGCWSSATVAAVDNAITDMADVLNYSISGGDDPWASAVDLAFLDAFTAGIFVSTSAGNDGPTPSTVAKTGPWNTAVAMSTHSRIMAHLIDAYALGGEMLDMGALEGDGTPLAADLTAPIIYGGDFDPANFEGCNAWPAGSFTGAIGLVSRGTCSFEIKINNLIDAGAVAALIYNNRSGPPIYMAVATATAIPAFMVGQADGLALAALITGDATATATIPVAMNLAFSDDFADIVSDGSSRGPSQWELLKPDFAAPGVNILAAVAAYGEDPVQYDFYQGTSMASPHGAGAAALLMAIHPDWSPAEIKSAIATTANQDMLEEDTTDTVSIISPAELFDMGSGRIDLSAAAFAGFVLNETSANYIAANPYLGGEPNTLNQPSMVSYNCLGICTWTRTIKSSMDVAQDWEISFEADAGVELSASPNAFTLPAGGTQTIEITADVTAAVADTYYFGNVILTPVGNEDISVAHLPVVVKLGVSNLPSQLDILTDQLASTVTLTDLQSTIEIEDLWIEIGGLTQGQAHDLLLDQDPTNGDPFDDLSQVYWTTINVPREGLRLVAEIAASEAQDVDLFVGSGNTPSADTILCASATGVWAEYCNIDFPAKGTYWVLVQNWGGSAEQPDAIRAITAVVCEGAEGNLTVTGPESVPALDLFDLDVNWDEPSMVAGDFWYAQFSVGTERREAGNLGYTNVDLEFYEPFYDIDLTPAADAKQDAPGAVVSYLLTLSNLGNTEDTITVAALGNVWDVNLPVTSFDIPAGGTADVTVEVTIPLEALDGEFDVVTITASSEGGVEASSELTTTAMVAPEPFITYLPIVFKLAP